LIPSNFLKLTIVLVAAGLAGCATPRVSQTMLPPQRIAQRPIAVTPINIQPKYQAPISIPQGMSHYHIVKPKETLWRIGKLYSVPIRTIMKVNNIRDEKKISIGQSLLIPGVSDYRPPIPLYRNTGRWKYIVIHHTATPTGNADTINALHKRRGWKNGLGYHFIVDNGTASRAMGQIEVGHRWQKQMNGAHANHSNMNKVGIGISLIGNFSETKVTNKQLESVTYLVDTLRRQYNIPKKRVIRHNAVPGAATECPGTKFPWAKFKNTLS
jgi:N-acetylmuramoyl-L-alanine amidase